MDHKTKVMTVLESEAIHAGLNITDPKVVKWIHDKYVLGKDCLFPSLATVHEDKTIIEKEWWL